MERLSKNHVMREIQEDRETSLRCYEDKPTRDIVNFCYDCIEKAINDLPQDYPRNTDEVERWIPVTEKMPEEHNYLGRLYARCSGICGWLYEFESTISTWRYIMGERNLVLVSMLGLWYGYRRGML